MFRPLFQFWKSWILSVLCSDLLKYRDGVDMYKHQCSKPCIWHSNCKQRLIQRRPCVRTVWTLRFTWSPGACFSIPVSACFPSSWHVHWSVSLCAVWEDGRWGVQEADGGIRTPRGPPAQVVMVYSTPLQLHHTTADRKGQRQTQ